MNTISEIDKAYIAGLFDGEGCISILVNKPRGQMRHPSHFLVCIVAMTEFSTVDWLHKTVGAGSLNEHSANRARGHRANWGWHINSNEASVFLQLILPYLHNKKSQAELAIEFQSLGTRRSGVHGKVEEWVIERRQWYASRMKELKNQNPPPPSDRETEGQGRLLLNG